MKDYRLSEIKEICIKHYVKQGVCAGCPIQKLCYKHLVDSPRDWDIENSNEAD